MGAKLKRPGQFRDWGCHSGAQVQGSRGTGLHRTGRQKPYQRCREGEAGTPGEGRVREEDRRKLCLETLPSRAGPLPCISFLWKQSVLVIQLCLTLCDPMDSSPSGSSVHRILQARIMEWAAMPYSRGSSQLRDGTQVFCIAGSFFFFFFTVWATREVVKATLICIKNFLPLKWQAGFLCFEGAGGWGLLGEEYQVRKPESRIYLVGKEQRCHQDSTKCFFFK